MNQGLKITTLDNAMTFSTTAKLECLGGPLGPVFITGIPCDKITYREIHHLMSHEWTDLFAYVAQPGRPVELTWAIAQSTIKFLKETI
jgi:hypothetical protein